ncbi:MAG TPA: glycosyl hydrolase, partial [Candidatus Wallbacteria bacterium]|nr:glycosyl hydrolase [Candidatus Wallbacteria bacterium]
PYATLLKVREFFESGGIVAGYGFLPSKSASLGHDSREVAALVEAIWGNPEPSLEPCRTHPSGGKAFLLPETVTPETLQTVFRDKAGIRPTLEVVDGDTENWLHVLHRVKDGRDVFFVANQLHEGPAKHFTLRVHAKGFPECWDPLRNEIGASVHAPQRNGARRRAEKFLRRNRICLRIFRKLRPGQGTSEVK